MKWKSKKKWKCNTCNANKTDKDTGPECDLCQESVGVECTTYSEDVIVYLRKNKVDFNFICTSCKETLPDLRNMLEISNKQQKLKLEVDQHDTRITRSEVLIEEMTTKKANRETQFQQLNDRLVTLEAKIMDTEEVETIAQKCFKTADFPTINELGL